MPASRLSLRYWSEWLVCGLGLALLLGIMIWLIRRHRQDRDHINSLQERSEFAKTYLSQTLGAIESEMRNSLNGITGYAEYIAHQASDPLIQFTGTIIYENSLKLLKTADVMLDLIHVHPEEATAVSTPFSLHAYFGTLRRDYAFSLQEKSLLLECQIDPNVPAILNCKGQLVRKVIANLVENAIRFCGPNGHIRLHAEVAQDQTYVHVRVEDDGVLLSRASVSSLLEQTGVSWITTAQHPIGDAGVSLAIANRLALSIGGGLHHTPTLDKGNMFHFFFPLSREE